MPWKSVGMVEERLRIVVSVERGEAPIGVLCAAHGISRETRHRWRAGYSAARFTSVCTGSKPSNSGGPR